jgi:hypothetical protein
MVVCILIIPIPTASDECHSAECDKEEGCVITDISEQCYYDDKCYISACDPDVGCTYTPV